MRRIESFKRFINFSSAVISGGQAGALFCSGFGIITCLFTKFMLKCMKIKSVNEKGNKLINTFLKFNIIYFLVSLLSFFIKITKKQYNVITFISITIISIIVYILIKKIRNKVIKKEE